MLALYRNSGFTSEISPADFFAAISLYTGTGNWYGEAEEEQEEEEGAG